MLLSPLEFASADGRRAVRVDDDCSIPPLEVEAQAVDLSAPAPVDDPELECRNPVQLEGAGVFAIGRTELALGEAEAPQTRSRTRHRELRVAADPRNGRDLYGLEDYPYRTDAKRRGAVFGEIGGLQSSSRFAAAHGKGRQDR